MDKLEQSQIRALREIFDTYDIDKSERISYKELAGVLYTIGLRCTEAEVQDMIAQVDDDGSGTLDFPEFCNFMSSRLRDTDPDEEALDVFRRNLDVDKDGVLSASDLIKAAKGVGVALSPEMAADMLKEADLDGTGAISTDSFLRLMRSN